MPRFLLSCNGDYFNSDDYDSIVKSCDYFMAVDGGIRHLVNLGIKPDLWVGDMDSSVDYDIPNISVNTENLRERKDYSDAEYAVNRAIELGADSIVMIGGIGSRIDHSMFNVNILLKHGSLGMDFVILDGRQEIRYLKKENLILGKKGKTLSIVPYSEINGLSMNGFSYPLKDYNVKLFEGLTLSNEVTDDRATIRKQWGCGVIVISDGH